MKKPFDDTLNWLIRHEERFKNISKHFKPPLKVQMNLELQKNGDLISLIRKANGTKTLKSVHNYLCIHYFSLVSWFIETELKR